MTLKHTMAALALAAGALLASAPAEAQVAPAGESSPAKASASFAPARLLMSADKPMGGSCLYPSPVLYDLDGDGTREMVIGDLRGFLTVVKRTDKGWGAESKLLGADGKPLKFSNW